MNKGDQRAIETATTKAIRAVIASQSAASDVRNGILGARAADELTLLIEEVTRTHQAAVEAIREIVAAVANGGVESVSRAAQSTLDSVESARIAATQLSVSRTEADAEATSAADKAALLQITQFKAAFEAAPELERIKRFQLTSLLKAFPPLNASQTLGLLAGAAIFVMAMIGLAVIGSGILNAKEIVDKLAKPEYARGVITYILAIGTVAVILVLLVSALLGSDGKENFARGKEILTVLIGIFGTILGFYFGTANASKTESEANPAASASPALTASPAAMGSPTISTSPAATASPVVTISPTATASP